MLFWLWYNFETWAWKLKTLWNNNWWISKLQSFLHFSKIVEISSDFVCIWALPISMTCENFKTSVAFFRYSVIFVFESFITFKTNKIFKKISNLLPSRTNCLFLEVLYHVNIGAILPPKKVMIIEKKHRCKFAMLRT